MAAGHSHGDGRAVQSSALIALALLVPAPTIGVLAAMWWWPGSVGQSVYFLSKVWIVVLPALWLLTVDKRRVVWRGPEVSSCRVGLGLGLVLGGTIVGAYALLGSWIDEALFREAAARIGLDTRVRYLALAAYLSLINSLVEEYVWRWFVFRKCEALVRGYPAVLLSALLFTLHHVFALAAQMPWLVTVLSSLGVFLGGAVWSWCYLRYRSIWPGYVSHVVADVAIFWIGWQLLFG